MCGYLLFKTCVNPSGLIYRLLSCPPWPRGAVGAMADATWPELALGSTAFPCTHSGVQALPSPMASEGEGVASSCPPSWQCRALVCLPTLPGVCSSSQSSSTGVSWVLDACLEQMPLLMGSIWTLSYGSVSHGPGSLAAVGVSWNWLCITSEGLASWRSPGGLAEASEESLEEMISV